jgi:endonuclease/exonuclease/phosphatase family metal-dependent hydrolase
VNFLTIIVRHWKLSISLFLSVLSYGSVLIPPSYFGIAVLIGFTIPFFLILNSIQLLYLVIRLKIIFLFPLIGLIAGLPFIFSSLSFHVDKAKGNASFSVLSYNAKLFRQRNTYEQFSTDMIKWVVEDNSDVKCIQEFSTNDKWDGLDVAGKLTQKGYQRYTFQSKIKDNEHNLGLAIFSRYEIANSGVIWEDTTSLNAIIFIDLLLSRDTLRVYNVHLTSMNLDLTGGGVNSMSMTYRLIESAARRSDQISRLIEHARLSPHPVIICGDFNESPYGFNYRQVVHSFANSFENAGNGFGFTYNNRIVPLRIDHQFYGKEVRVLDYSVDYKMKISDHFPTKANYEIKDL